ncbi:MAG: HAMP domain-containing sensor histidine kinase [Cyclobacteriaceae bacterium]
MRTYRFFSSLPWINKSFTSKIIVVTFLGIHMPLIGLIWYLLFSQLPTGTAMNIFIVTLIVTLVATTVTIWIISRLIEPVRIVKNAVNNYVIKQEMPQLPQYYRDEIGTLMKDSQFALVQLDSLLKGHEEILTIFSHDLRSSFNSMLSAAELMKLDESNKEKQKHIQLLENRANEQLNFLKKTLKSIKQRRILEQQGSGIEEVNLKDFIEPIIEERKISVTAKKLTILQNIEDSTIKIHCEVVSRVFNNVLDNAIKFTDEGGTIAVSAGVVNDELRIDVTDDGLGFDQNNVTQIFEYNSPLSRQGTSDEGSGGIGMYLSKNLLQKQGGALLAFSDGPGQGSKFCIKLPLHSQGQ